MTLGGADHIAAEAAFAAGDEAEVAVELDRVSVWTPEQVSILDDVSWTIRTGEQWALLGPNGAGKTTLLSIVAGWRHPSAGTATVLGGRLGKVDLAELRRQIGLVDPAGRVLDWLTVEEVVLTGASGTIRPLWDRYGLAERALAREMLARVGCVDLLERPIASCSQGERQRVRIARALMARPRLLILDEPAVGLDLPAREAVLATLRALRDADPALTTIVVTHHLEELPESISHVLLLAKGCIVAAGAPEATLTGDLVSCCFGLPVRVGREDGRWWARALPGWERGGRS